MPFKRAGFDFLSYPEVPSSIRSLTFLDVLAQLRKFRAAVPFCPSVQFLPLFCSRKMNRDRHAPARLICHSRSHRIPLPSSHHGPSGKRLLSITGGKRRLFTLLQTLCRSEKSQLLWNQANPDSFCKMPGWGGHPECFYRTPRVGVPPQLTVWFAASICSPFLFRTLQIPFPATPLLAHLYKTPGVLGVARD